MNSVGTPLVLRCIAYPGRNLDEEGYYGHCIDLDLMVFRPKIEDAMAEIEEQILGYFDNIHSLEEFNALVPRPAPFWPHRGRYHFVALTRAVPAAWRALNSTLYDRAISQNEFSAMGVNAC